MNAGRANSMDRAGGRPDCPWPTGRKIAVHAGHRSVLSHRHKGVQGDALAAAFGDEARAQAVAAEVTALAALAGSPLHDLGHRLAAGVGAERGLHGRRKSGPSLSCDASSRSSAPRRRR